MQQSALKIIFGYNHSQEELLSLSGLPSLEERRSVLFRNFCMKIYSNSRFREQWLDTRIFTGHDLRNQNIIVEKFARTERLYKSPLYTIRRNLNDILIN